MSLEAQIAAFEGGQLRVLASGRKSREAVLAIPLSSLLVKLVRVPAGGDPVEAATPVLQAMNPYPDEPLTVSCETVSEGADGAVVLAGALPEGATDGLAEALDAAKLSVVRIDALALGQLRGVWKALGESSQRRLVLMRSADCLSAFVLDGDRPAAVRALTVVGAEELRRELTLFLLEAEDFGGRCPLAEVVVVEADGAVAEEGDACLGALAAFGPVRRIAVGADAALVGVGERSDDASALNVLPSSWREVLEETRFKAKLTKCLAVAGGIWGLVIAVLFGVPVAYGYLADHQKALSRQHARQYEEVRETRDKVNLIHKYSDHARGALEIMKALSDRLPEGVTLSSWNFRREDGVKVSGEADSAEAVYAFKDAMDEMSAGEGEDAERIFGEVLLNGPSASKGRYRFDLDCRYAKEEE